MAGLRRARLAVNKRKTNAWTNKRGDIASKIVVRWLSLCRARPPQHYAIRDEEDGRADGWWGEIIRGWWPTQRPKGKINRWIFIKLNHCARPWTAGSESVFVHCLAHLIANINTFYLPSHHPPRMHHPPRPFPWKCGISVIFFLLCRYARQPKRAVRKFNVLIWSDQTFVRSFGITIEKGLIFWF